MHPVRAGRAGSNANIGYGSHVTLIETNPPHRGRPPCPPACNALLVVAGCNVGINAGSLARWMDRVRAGRAESNTNIGYGSHVTFYETNPPRRGRPLRRPARIVLLVAAGCNFGITGYRLRGGCIAFVPRSPDVTQKTDDRSVRLG